MSQSWHHYAATLLLRHFLMLPRSCQLTLTKLSFPTNWQYRYNQSSEVVTTLWQRPCVCWVGKFGKSRLVNTLSKREQPHVNEMKNIGWVYLFFKILKRRKCVVKTWSMLFSKAVVQRYYWKIGFLEVLRRIRYSSPFLISRFLFSWSISSPRWRRKSRVFLRNNFSVVVIL